MSDYYEFRDYNFDDKSGNKRRRKKRRSRYMRPDEDAWGQAYSVDDYESDDAPLDDIAAGMVPEEYDRYYGRDIWIEEPGGNVDAYVPQRSESPSASARRIGRGASSSQEIGDESPAMRRANKLLNRYGRDRNRGEVLEYLAKDEVESPFIGPEQTGDIFDRIFDFDFSQFNLAGTIPMAILVLLAIIVIVSVSCVGAAWFTAAEIRRALDLSSFLMWI